MAETVLIFCEESRTGCGYTVHSLHTLVNNFNKFKDVGTPRKSWTPLWELLIEATSSTVLVTCTDIHTHSLCRPACATNTPQLYLISPSRREDKSAGLNLAVVGPRVFPLVLFYFSSQSVSVLIMETGDRLCSFSLHAQTSYADSREWNAATEAANFMKNRISSQRS